MAHLTSLSHIFSRSSYLTHTGPFMVALAVFLAVLGIRLSLVAEHGSPVPFWDEWDAEGEMMYPALLKDEYHWQDIFLRHNEHRIAPSKLVMVALFRLHGLWDPILQMICNAVLHAVLSVVAFAALRQSLPQSYRTLVSAILVLLLFGVPFDHDNALSGFQSQFEFLLIFSFLSLWCFTIPKPLSPRWWLGWIPLAFATVSMGSGFFPALAAPCAYAVAAGFDVRRRTRRDLVAGLSLLAFAVIALAIHKAETGSAFIGMETFLQNLGRFLSWPMGSNIAWALFTWLPLVVGAVCLLKSQKSIPPGLLFLLALSAWYSGQVAAISASRAEPDLASRYMSIATSGTLAAVAWCLHIRSHFSQSASSSWIQGGTALWISTLALFGTQYWYSVAHPKLIANAENRASHVALMSAYLQTPDLGNLEPQKLHCHPPYPNTERLASILSIGGIKEILPTEIRPPLKPAPVIESSIFQASHLPKGLTVPPSLSLWGSHPHDTGPKATGKTVLQFDRDTFSPWLEIWVAGEPSPKGTSLIVQDINGKRKIPVYQGRRPGPYWTRALLNVPYTPFQLVADDKFDDRWFAFTAPKATGRLEPVKVWILSQSGTIGSFAVGLFVLILFSSMHLNQKPALPAARPQETNSV